MTKRRAEKFRPARVVRCAAIMLAVVAASSTPARAQWVAHVGAADAFGEPTVLAVDAHPSGDALLLLCDRTHLLSLAYLMPGTPTELVEMAQPGAALPVTLRVRIGNGAQRQFDAKLRRWNGTYLGAIAGGRTAELVAMVRRLGAATEPIHVGLDILGDKQSEQFGSAGSAAAMAMAMQQCKLDGASSD